MRLATLLARGGALLLTLALAAGAQSSADEQGIQLFKARRYDEARTIFLPVAKAGTDAVAFFYLGRIAMEQNQVDDAIDWFERAVKAEDQNAEYHVWLGNAYGTKAGHASKLKQPFLAKKVKAEFERAAQLDPKNIEARSGLVQFYLQAPGIMGGSKEKAKQYADEMKRLDPWVGGFTLANVYTDMKDNDAAEREYLALAHAFPDSTQPVVQLAVGYQQRALYDKAWAVVDEALKRAPNEPAYVFQVGRIAAVSGQQLDRGKQALDRYLTFPAPAPGKRPSLAAAHYRLGDIAAKRGDRATARQEYQTALQMDPKLEQAKKALEALK